MGLQKNHYPFITSLKIKIETKENLEFWKCWRIKNRTKWNAVVTEYSIVLYNFDELFVVELEVPSAGEIKNRFCICFGHHLKLRMDLAFSSNRILQETDVRLFFTCGTSSSASNVSCISFVKIPGSFISVCSRFSTRTLTWNLFSFE